MSIGDDKYVQEVQAKDLVRELTHDTSEQDTERSLLPLCNARIWGEFDLKHRTITKPVEIRDCEFEGEVDLRYCEFDQLVDFSGCTFQREFNSGDETASHTVYKKDLICNRVIFERMARFNGVRVEGSAHFSKANFLHKEPLSVDFTLAFIEKTFDCGGAVFAGLAVFNALRCNGFGAFSKASFRGNPSVDFNVASFGVVLYCDETLFEGSANFRRIQCDGYLSFRRAMFAHEVDFTNASCGDMYFDHITFEYSVSFNSLKCRNLYCDVVAFNEATDLSEAEILQSLGLAGARFRSNVSFRAASTTRLLVESWSGEEAFPFPENAVDLRGFTFKDYAGTWSQARQLADAQDPTKFSIDPYLQFEEYFKSSGDETSANLIYYIGRVAQRKNVYNPDGSTKWSVGRKLRDTFVRSLTGYGVRASRPVVLIVYFIVVGTIVFLPSNALKVEGSSTPSAPNEEQIPESRASSAWQSFAYSADLALPTISFQGVSLLEVNTTKELVPQGAFRRAYAVIQQIAGQFLVLLFVATLLGYTRRW